MRILPILRRFTTNNSIFFSFWLVISATFGFEAYFVAIRSFRPTTQRRLAEPPMGNECSLRFVQSSGRSRSRELPASAAKDRLLAIALWTVATEHFLLYAIPASRRRASALTSLRYRLAQLRIPSSGAIKIL